MIMTRLTLSRMGGFKFRWLLAFCGLALEPLYFFESGLPQISDFLIAAYSVSACLAAIMGGFLRRAPIFLAFWAAFVFVTLAVSLTWVIIDADPRILVHPIFYLFNFLFGLALLWDVNQSETFPRFLYYGVVVGLLVSTLGVAISYSGGGRNSGFFNNPNQLAYYSLCGLVVILALDGSKIALSPARVIAYFSAIIGIVAASSISAFAGFFVIAISVLSDSLINFKKTLGLLLLSSTLFVGFIAADKIADSGFSRGIENRMLRTDAKVTNLNEERGFDRIIAYPKYIVLGAGEGGTDRFPLSHHGEIHSSLLNVLFSYGLLGLGFLTLTILFSLRRARLVTYGLVLGLLVYSLTHMGLRSTPFWLALCVIYFSNTPRRGGQRLA